MNSNQQQGGKPDYLDKGVAMLQKKQGMTPNASRDEKITDKVRGLFEKITGKKVSSKISN